MSNKEMLKYANYLIDFGKKYKRKDYYDFSKAKSPSEKTRIIRSWIGEILHEAVKYKNKAQLESLEKTISSEIRELIKQK